VFVLDLVGQVVDGRRHKTAQLLRTYINCAEYEDVALLLIEEVERIRRSAAAYGWEQIGSRF